jgi:hypothetical protein
VFRSGSCEIDSLCRDWSIHNAGSKKIWQSQRVQPTGNKVNKIVAWPATSQAGGPGVTGIGTKHEQAGRRVSDMMTLTSALHATLPQPSRCGLTGTIIMHLHTHTAAPSGHTQGWRPQFTFILCQCDLATGPDPMSTWRKSRLQRPTGDALPVCCCTNTTCASGSHVEMGRTFRLQCLAKL